MEPMYLEAQRILIPKTAQRILLLRTAQRILLLRTVQRILLPRTSPAIRQAMPADPTATILTKNSWYREKKTA